MGYTLAYGRTYPEWAAEKAQRIRSLLSSRRRFRRDEMVEYAWRERLLLDERKRPSIFVRNFTAYLVAELKGRGYLRERVMLTVKDVGRGLDSASINGGGAPDQGSTPQSSTPKVRSLEIRRELDVKVVPSLSLLVDLCTYSDP